MLIKKPRLFLSIFLLIIVFLLVLKGASYLFLSTVFKSIKAPRVPVYTATLETHHWSQIVRTPASVVPKDEIVVMSKTHGFLDGIAVLSGQIVQQGDLLFSLENKEQYYSLEKGKQGRDLAKNSYLRMKELYEQSMIAQERYDESLTRWNQAEAQVNYLQTLYDNTKVYAPFTGRVDYVTLSPGQFVQAGSKLFSLSSLPPYEVEFTLPQELFAQIFNADVVKVSMEDKEYTAHVVDVSQSVDKSTRRFFVRALMEEESNLATGRSATVVMEIPHLEKESFVLPLDQIDFTALGPILWTYEKNDQEELIAHSIPIDIRDQRLDQCLIESEVLEESLPIITAGFQKLYEGATIKVIEQNELI